MGLFITQRLQNVAFPRIDVVKSSGCWLRATKDFGVAKIYNLGSINVDHVYTMARLPAPGETLSADDQDITLGGKGLNISVAIQRAGADVTHIGAVGRGDQLVQDLLAEQGVDCSAIDQLETRTGHAIIYVDAQSENQIVIMGGANQAISQSHVRASLANAQAGDWLVLQNETNANEIGLSVAREKGMKVALVAAPFDVETMPDLIQRVDLVTMNQSETDAFELTIGRSFQEVQGPEFLITYGADGAEFFGATENARIASHKVKAVDTTGAGDTFFGSFLAEYATGKGVEQALTYANAAAALQVQSPGASQAIPNRNDVVAFLNR
ncbi:MAG: ribokinase [Paracoccaceae bacterium]